MRADGVVGGPIGGLGRQVNDALRFANAAYAAEGAIGRVVVGAAQIGRHGCQA
jgi:hypothetical protein